MYCKLTIRAGGTPVSVYIKVLNSTNRLFGRKGIFASRSGVHRELSWLLSVVRDTESDMRDGDEQLLLFWLLLATVSSSRESASFPSSVN